GHLAWHFLTESLTLTALAGVCALALAYAGLKLMLSLAPADLPRLDEVHLAWTSVAFTAIVSLGAGGLFGLLPLTSVGRGGEDVTTLREGGRGMTSSRRQHAVRGTLVAAQTALALVLLVASGLMLQSFRNLRGVRPGFDARGLLTARIDLPYARYQSYEKVEQFQRELLARAGALTGVKSAASGSDIPLDGYNGCATIYAEGDVDGKSTERGCVTTTSTTPGYFATLGVPIRGREPSWSDVENRTGAVVITKALATRLWPGQDAIGRGIRGNGGTPPYYRVVGVADDIRGIALDKPVIEAAFYPLLPIPGAQLWSPQRSMSIVVRTTSSRPELLTPSLRRIVSELDPNVPLGEVRTMETVVARSMTRLSFTMMLLGVAASMAMVLSAIGIYGVISYIVGRRRGEIGIRVALGARAGQVGAMVVAQSVKLAAAGVVAGLIGSLAVTRVMRSVLFEVSPTDPLTLGGVSALMLLLAAGASYIPARRATRVNPVEALRSE
ncbi:MAG: ABC transporter permease, partial [Gemmatimonadota bacterium]|nr:ABC transporter permease [Gemmatimonadota bacterium]